MFMALPMTLPAMATTCWGVGEISPTRRVRSREDIPPATTEITALRLPPGSPSALEAPVQDAVESINAMNPSTSQGH